jgi:hypothetical protein
LWDFEGSGCGLMEVLFCSFLGRTEENHVILRVVGVLPEI